MQNYCNILDREVGACNHIVARFYLIHYRSSAKQTEIPADLSSTSMAQEWHVPKGDKVEPAPVMKLSFAKPATDGKNKIKGTSVLLFV